VADLEPGDLRLDSMQDDIFDRETILKIWHREDRQTSIDILALKFPQIPATSSRQHNKTALLQAALQGAECSALREAQ
jgi:hypothetical protein